MSFNITKTEVAFEAEVRIENEVTIIQLRARGFEIDTKMENQINKPPTGKVFISFIKDIRTFYVVNEKFMNYEQNWFKVCELEAKQLNNKLTDIEIDDIYLFKYNLDEKYYRVLLKEVKSDCCIVQFIDYGNDLSVKQEQLLKCPEMLKSCKPRAQECTFYNIKWNTIKEKNKALACVAGER